MRIVAVNGSPRGKRSNTDCILQPFLSGARQAGAETETVYLKDFKINYCLGCFTCWTKTPGKCIQKDDMPILLEKMRGADIVIYATPLYIFTVSGLMKNFMDRFVMPFADPHILMRGEYYSHPSRYKEPKKNSSMRGIVLISNCGFPGENNFSALVETFRVFTDVSGLKLKATILRSMGEMFSVPGLESSFEWYFDAAKKAGREVVELGHVSPETQGILDKDLMAPEDYVTMANAYWDSEIAKAKKKKR